MEVIKLNTDEDTWPMTADLYSLFGSCMATVVKSNRNIWYVCVQNSPFKKLKT